MENVHAYRLSVFPYSLDIREDGGNPTTIFLGADDLGPSQMQSLAKKNGHECCFVLSGQAGEHADCHLTLRYWVPNHEMEMCGHATVGTIWLMDHLGLLPATDDIRISTRSGVVEAQVLKAEDGSPVVRVSQPAGSLEDLPSNRVLDIVSCLGITKGDLAPSYKVHNGRTSRTKTLVPLKSREILNGLNPNPDLVREICENIDSTGLYPYAVLNAQDQLVEARQFPRSSGYAEDPATGIAAAALAFSLLDNTVFCRETAKPVRVRQGWTMGKPSEIQVHLRQNDGKLSGCWISGKVRWATTESVHDT
ncbi:hypothetical protein N7474_002018 [Penicillium riverlandense]|uniref:uncharacterized protein n=1 Tax=Penicillium riverlandense TaxID=1903569 RepID=UPI002549C056|nr:uncharacterized protein N7474_002018 [Penicillium riverlandense]KAJ5833707.1 hypothetical protein N7474_002018 [Penicillium riverlandense]